MATTSPENNPLSAPAVRGPVHRLFDVTGQGFDTTDVRATLHTTFDLPSLRKIWTQSWTIIEDDPLKAASRYKLGVEDVYRHLSGQQEPRLPLGKAVVKFIKEGLDESRKLATVGIGEPFYQYDRAQEGVVSAQGQPDRRLAIREVSFTGRAAITGSKSAASRGSIREFAPTESVIYASVAPVTDGDERPFEFYYTSTPTIGRPSHLRIPGQVVDMLELPSDSYADFTESVAGTLANLALEGNNT